MTNSAAPNSGTRRRTTRALKNGIQSLGKAAAVFLLSSVIIGGIVSPSFATEQPTSTPEPTASAEAPAQSPAPETTSKPEEAKPSDTILPPAPSATPTPTPTVDPSDESTAKPADKPAKTPKPAATTPADNPVARAVTPGSVVDLKTVIDGPASANGGETFTYTVTITNNLNPGADGAAFVIAPPAGAKDVLATCTATAGATCGPTAAVSDSEISGTVGLLPHLGVVTFTFTGRYPIGKSSVTATADVTPPTTTTDADEATNHSSVSTALTTEVKLSATQVLSATSVAPGDVVTVTLTVSNDGPSAADGAYFMHYFPSWGSAAQDVFGPTGVKFLSCNPTGGIVCPTFFDNPGGNPSIQPISTTIPVFPAGSKMTIVFELTTSEKSGSTGCRTDTSYFESATRVDAPSGVTEIDTNDNRANANLPVTIPLCPVTDLTIKKVADSSNIAPGDTVSYTVTIANEGDLPANGASIIDVLNVSGSASFNVFGPVSATFVSCTEVAGAVCPAFSDATGTRSIQLFGGTIDTFPAHSSIVIIYSVKFSELATSIGCRTDSGSIENFARVEAPRGITDPNQNNNRVSLFAGQDIETCPTTDLSLTKTSDRDTVKPGKSVRFTVTVSNNGPTDADDALITDYLAALGGDINQHFGGTEATLVSCTEAGGAVCPALVDSAGSATSLMIFNTTIPKFPSGSSIVIVYDTKFLDLESSTSCVTSGNFQNSARVEAPAGVTESNDNNNRASVNLEVAPCADVAVNKSVSPSLVRAGETVTFTIDVTNATFGLADSILLTDPLPDQFVFGSAECTVVTGTPECGTSVDYDPAANLVSTIIPKLLNGDKLRLTITGIAGPKPGTYRNVAFATDLDGTSLYYDPNPVSNSSQVNMQIFNTESSITVTKTVAGLGATGLDTAKTFTGVVDCGTEGKQSWSVEVPAGKSTAAAKSLSFADGQACTITEDTPPQAPAGYAWVGNPVIAPDAIVKLGNEKNVDVSVTNTVERTAPRIIVTKIVEGGPATGLDKKSVFAGDITCSTDGVPVGDAEWKATVAKGSTTGAAAAHATPVGAECAVTESTPPAAPKGYEWTGEPGIEYSIEGPLAATDNLTVTVTNVLAEVSSENETPGNPNSDPEDDPTGTLAFTGLEVAAQITGAVMLLVLGAALLILARRRRRERTE